MKDHSEGAEGRGPETIVTAAVVIHCHPQLIRLIR